MADFEGGRRCITPTAREIFNNAGHRAPNHELQPANCNSVAAPGAAAWGGQNRQSPVYAQVCHD